MLFDSLMTQDPYSQGQGNTQQPLPFGSQFQPQSPVSMQPSQVQPVQQPLQPSQAAPQAIQQPQGMAPMTTPQGEEVEQQTALQSVVPGVAENVPSDGGVQQKIQQMHYDASQVRASEYDPVGFQFRRRLDMRDNTEDQLMGVGQTLLTMGLTYLASGDMDAAIGSGFNHYSKLVDQGFRAKQIEQLRQQGYTDASIEEFVETGSKNALVKDKRTITTDQYGNTISVNPFNPNDRYIIQSNGVEKYDAASQRMVRVFNDGMGNVTVKAQDGSTLPLGSVDLRDPQMWQQEQQTKMKQDQMAFDRKMSLDASARGWESLRQSRELKELQLQEQRDRRDAAAEAKAAAEAGRKDAEKEKAYQKVAVEQTRAQQPLTEAADSAVEFMMNPQIMSQGGKLETLPGVQAMSRFANPEIYNQMDTMLSKQFVSIAATKPFGGNPSNLESNAMSEANSAGLYKDKNGNWAMKAGITPDQVTKLAFNAADRSLYNKEKADYMLENRLTSTTPEDERYIRERVQNTMKSYISQSGGEHLKRLEQLYKSKYGSDIYPSQETSIQSSEFGHKYGY